MRGYRACIVDYFPKQKYPKSRKAARWALNGTTALVLYGLYEFETNDVGIAEAVKRIWTA
jgi:succinate dehydrogenase (ubiquinone) membrane anchor subunit